MGQIIILRLIMLSIPLIVMFNLGFNTINIGASCLMYFTMMNGAVLLSSFGIQSSVYRFYAEEPGRKFIFHKSIILLIIIASFTVSFFLSFVICYFYEEYNPWYLISSIVLGSILLYWKFYFLSKAQIILSLLFENTIIFIIVGAYSLVQTVTVLGLQKTYVVAQVISLILIKFYRMLEKEDAEYSTGTTFQVRTYLNIRMREMMNLYSSNVIGYVNSWGAVIMLGNLLAETILAQYLFSLRLVSVIIQVKTTIAQLYAPRMAQCYHASQYDKFTEIFVTVREKFRYCAIVLVFLLILVLAHQLWLADNVKISLELSLIFIGQIALLYIGPYNSTLTMTGNEDYNRNLLIVSSIISVGLPYLFILIFQSPFVSLSLIIANVTVAILFELWVSYKVNGLK